MDSSKFNPYTVFIRHPLSGPPAAVAHETRLMAYAHLRILTFIHVLLSMTKGSPPFGEDLVKKASKEALKRIKDAREVTALYRGDAWWITHLDNQEKDYAWHHIWLDAWRNSRWHLIESYWRQILAEHRSAEYEGRKYVSLSSIE